MVSRMKKKEAIIPDTLYPGIISNILPGTNTGEYMTMPQQGYDIASMFHDF
jgi:hypothetical protein